LAETGPGDALDSALGKALADALSAVESSSDGQTKSARVRRHRDAIVALKAKNWSWERIAETLSAGGLKVSARTVRLEIVGKVRSGKKGANSSRNGKANRRTPEKRTAPASDKETGPATETPVEAPAKIPTGDGFYRAEEVDN
jgi:hypothetical protein